MKKTCECKVCAKPTSKYWFENKLVCFRCDELTFDIAIETDESAEAKTNKQGTVVIANEPKANVK